MKVYITGAKSVLLAIPEAKHPGLHVLITGSVCAFASWTGFVHVERRSGLDDAGRLYRSCDRFRAGYRRRPIPILQAKKYRARTDKIGKKAATPKFETLEEVIRRLPPERQAEIAAGAEAISTAIELARLNHAGTKTPKKEN